MIIISPSRGGGDVEIGGQAILFDGTYKDTFPFDTAYFQLSSDGTAAGEYTTVSGPDNWTWLLNGSASDFDVYCQPTSGSVKSGSAPINSWLNLGTTRIWTRSGTVSNPVFLAITIRLASTLVTQATCTIKLYKS